MALTDTLNPVAPQGNIVDARGTVGPSVLGGLANFASNLLGADSERSAKLRDAEGRAVKNQLVGSMLDAYQVMDEKARVPDTVKADGQDLVKLKAAVDQGRAPKSALDMRMEATIQKIRREHPDSLYVAWDYLSKDLQLDHAVFREGQYAQERADQEHKILSDQYQANLKVGAVIAPGKTVQEQVEAGALYNVRQQQLEAEKAYWDAKDKQITVEGKLKEQVKEKRLEASRKTFDHKWRTSLFGSVVDQFMLLQPAAGNSAEDATDFKKMGDNFIASLRMGRQHALAEYEGDPDMQKYVNETFDQWEKDIGNAANTPFEQRKAEYTFVTNTLGLESAQLFPIMNILKQTSPALVQTIMMDPTMGLSKERIAQIKQELQGVDFSSAVQREMFLPHMISMLRGKTEFTQIPKDMQSDAAKVLIGSVGGYGKQAASGTLDPVTAPNAVAPVQQLLTAVRTNITPNTKHMDAVSTATKSVANPEFRALVKQLVANPTTAEQGKALAVATVGTSAMLFTTAKNNGPKHDVETTQQVEYNATSGRFQLKPLTRADYERYVQVQRKVVSNSTDYISMDRGIGGMGEGQPIMSFDQFVQQKSPALVKQVDTLNAALDNMAGFKDYDEILKLNSEKAIRDYYGGVKGAQLKLPAQEGGDAHAQYVKARESLNAQISQISTGLPTDPDMSFDDKKMGPKRLQQAVSNMGWSPEATAAIMGHGHWESGGFRDSDIKNPNSSATHFWQWTKESGRLQRFEKLAKENGWGDPSSPQAQLQYLNWELTSPDSEYKYVGDRLRTAKTVEEATEIFSDFERAEGWTKDNPRGIDHWSDRLSLARKYYGG